MSRFTNETNYNLGTLSNQANQRETFLRDNQFENDIYEFRTTGTSNIDISLNNITTGDDADLYLYRDSNNNGILDSSDLQLSSSLHLENNDDAINYQAGAGTYFARVSYFSSTGDDRLDYQLDLSADSLRSGSTTIAAQRDYGTSLVGDNAAVETGYISNSNTSNAYAFSVLSHETYDITLTGLSNDADLRVIRDANHNNVVDAGEVYASSVHLGASDDSVTVNQAGDYFVEVYQYSGDTNYTLEFDQAFV
jgi:hypothetical protein